MLEIKDKIHSLRGFQVMLDSDLAELYEVETKVLNQAVKRNIERFPKNFMFQLSESEYESLRSQNVTLNLKSQIVTSISDNLISQNATSRWGGRRKIPYAFTEQGVSMLSAVLRSKKAVEVSIQIINAFVNMRKFLAENASVFTRIDNIERKQIIHDKNFEEIFDAIEDKTLTKKQGIFFDGQIFDAYRFINDLIRTANEAIVLIDNYIDDSVLTLFSKTKVSTTIYTSKITKQLKLDLEKYNKQYNNITIKEFKNSHDRFLIIDNNIYHVGASLKDLGKKWFAFSKFDKNNLEKIKKLVN